MTYLETKRLVIGRAKIHMTWILGSLLSWEFVPKQRHGLPRLATCPELSYPPCWREVGLLLSAVLSVD